MERGQASQQLASSQSKRRRRGERRVLAFNPIKKGEREKEKLQAGDVTISWFYEKRPSSSSPFSFPAELMIPISYLPSLALSLFFLHGQKNGYLRDYWYVSSATRIASCTSGCRRLVSPLMLLHHSCTSKGTSRSGFGCPQLSSQLARCLSVGRYAQLPSRFLELSNLGRRKKAVAPACFMDIELLCLWGYVCIYACLSESEGEI